MFGCCAPAPCDNWLGLHAYNDNKLVTHIDWVNQQLEQFSMLTNAKNRKVVGGKDLVIPIGNLVLLHDHPEGCNKIQDNNKDQIYVITRHHDH